MGKHRIMDASEAKQARFPRLLAGVGLFACAGFAGEMLARLWPAAAGPVLGSLFFVGMIWLAVVVLRTCERSAEPRSLSRSDRALIYWSGPLSVLLILVIPVIAFANIEERNAVNHFTSDWSFQVVEVLMASGFVLSFCCLAARQDRHLPPRGVWKVICAPLLLIFGAYALLMPVSRAAAKMGFE